MKNLLFLIIIITVISSCASQKIRDLEIEIQKLDSEYKEILKSKGTLEELELTNE